MSPAPGIYEGKLPDSLVMGRCYLNYALATEDSTEDTDKFPDKRRRPSSEVKLYVQPALTGPFYSQADETLYSVEPFVLTSNNGVFDFWAIDPTHSSIIPSGWVWTATLVDGSKTVGNITFSPDSTKPADQYVNLGLLAVTGSAASGSTAADLQTMLQTLLDSSSTGPAGRGIRTITSAGDVATVTYTDNTTQDFALPRGLDGEMPELTWSGTTLLINGSNGVDLKGAKGDAGPANTLSIGTVTEGNAAASITGTSPNQTLNLVIPKGDKGDPGTGGTAAVAGIITLPTGNAWVWNKYSRETSSAIATSSTLGGVVFVPLWVNQFVGAKIVAVTVKTASAGALLRLGVYSAGADLMPNALAFDAGTVDASTTGFKQATIGTGVTLPSGLYWIAVATQGATGATVGGSGGGAELLRVAFTADFTDPSGMIRSDTAGVTAALPATWTATLGAALGTDTFTVAVAR